MSVLNEPVLVLNNSWIPIDTFTVRNAFTKVFKGTAKIVDPADCVIYEFEEWLMLPVLPEHKIVATASGGFRLPEIIVITTEGRYGRRSRINFSRRNLAKRDGHICQYCGKGSGQMTIDHVMPQSRGGKGGWLNSVLACFPCNSRKGDKTPEEANMKLKQKPYEPKWSPVFRVSEENRRASWAQFIN